MLEKTLKTWNKKKHKDERYVHSSVCTWHGSIYEVAQTAPTKVRIDGKTIDGVSIPACPYCGGPLLEQESRAAWDESAKRFMAERASEMPLYLEWLESLHGPCTPLKGWDWRAAYAKFASEHEGPK